MSDFLPQPDDLGEPVASGLKTGYGDVLGARAGASLLSGVRTMLQTGQYNAAGATALEDADEWQLRGPQHGVGLLRERPPEMPIEQAQARLKEEGLEGHVKLPVQPTIRQGVLDLMIDHGHERRQLENTVSRGPHGFFPDALGFITELGVGIIDPVNQAAFAIPVVGEARYGQMMASAGTSILRRAAVRGGVGAGQGAVGGAALVPGDWWLHTKDGQDYTMADALHSVVMGAGMGGTMHAGFGAIGDVRTRSRGLPLKGSPEDLVMRGLMQGRHVPGEAITGEGVPLERLAPPAHPEEGPLDLPVETASEAAPASQLQLVPVERVRDPDQGDLRGPGLDYEIHQDGAAVAEASFTNLGDGHYHLDWIGSPRGWEGGPVDLGPSAVRGVLRQFLAAHPEARKISGSRVAGARGEALDYGAEPVEFDVVNGRLRLARPAPQHPSEVHADLPPRVREDLARAAIADVIADRPVRAGELLAIAAQHDPRIAESVGFDAWHGSPHEFEAFSSNRIGTGEGAQSYGRGHYAAERQGVADYYSKMVTLRDFMRKVQELYHEFDAPSDAADAIAASKDFTPGQKRLLAALEKDDWLGFDYPHQAVDAAVREPGNFEMSPETHQALRQLGHLYKVRIKANHEHMLDWDRRLAEQHPMVQDFVRGHADVQPLLTPDARVLDALHKDPKWRGAWDEDRTWRYIRDLMPGASEGVMQQVADRVQSHVMMGSIPEGATGEAIYHALSRKHGPAEASRLLHEAGIPGIKYLDQGSRPPTRSKPYLATDASGATVYRAENTDKNFATWDEAQAWIDARDRRELTRNFVVFDDKQIEITHKNGEPVQQPEVLPPRQNMLARFMEEREVEARQRGAMQRPIAEAAAAFRSLADRPPDAEAVGDAAASKAADAAPEPVSIDPAKAPTEAEKLAGEADALLKDIAPMLSASERAAFDEMLANLAQDRASAETILRDGAACLIEAIA